MTTIYPIKGLRPRKDIVDKVATLPYDVCSVEEARQFHDSPYSFYHVTHSEIDLPRDIDLKSEVVYQQAKENLDKLIATNVLVMDSSPKLYIYAQKANQHIQVGLVCGSSLKDYQNGVVKIHEYTRPEKELDRVNHIYTTQAQTGIIFLTYRDVPEIQGIINDWMIQHLPIYDFISIDEIHHKIWMIDQEAVINDLVQLFKEKVPATYIADGHHRTAAALKVAERIKAENPTIDTSLIDPFISCIFPASQMKIIDYNRVVKDLNGLTVEELLEKIAINFDIESVGTTPFKPSERQEYGMYVANNWYRLKVKPGVIQTQDTKSLIDTNVLQYLLLTPILGIEDPRTDHRIDFIGGTKGMQGLSNLVDSKEWEIAFSCYPISIEELFIISDEGSVMPPKSTWFEPKIRDGLIVNLINTK